MANLTDLNMHRQKRLREARHARLKHKDVGLASRKAIEATSAVLKAEIKARKTASDQPMPDLFEGEAA